MGIPKFEEADQYGRAPEQTDLNWLADSKEATHAMEVSRQKYADVMVMAEKDDAFRPYIKAEGRLNAVFKRMDDFHKWVFKNEQNYLNPEEIVQNLSGHFNEAMQSIIKKWQKLSMAGVEWNGFCWSMQKLFVEMGRVFGVGAEIQSYINRWFEIYRRDQLNSQALGAHRELAYYRTVGGGDKKIIDDVRGKIQNIEDQLSKLPLHEENYPAFSTLNPKNEDPWRNREMRPEDLSVLHGDYRKQKTDVSPWAQAATEDKRKKRVSEMPGVKEKPKKKKPWWKFW